jgi:bacterioferritin-associated ferredoxin
MIICICNNVNSQTIKSAIDCGANSVERVREVTGASACCGKCQFKVNRLVQDHVPADLNDKRLPSTQLSSASN